MSRKYQWWYHPFGTRENICVLIAGRTCNLKLQSTLPDDTPGIVGRFGFMPDLEYPMPEEMHAGSIRLYPDGKAVFLK